METRGLLGCAYGAMLVSLAAQTSDWPRQRAALHSRTRLAWVLRHRRLVSRRDSGALRTSRALFHGGHSGLLLPGQVGNDAQHALHQHQLGAMVHLVFLGR